MLRGLAQLCLVATAVVSNACGSGEVFLQWPDLPAETQSVIVIVETDRELEAWALPWTEDATFRPMVRGRQVDLTVVALSGELEDHELPSGAIELVEPRACLALRFPPSDAIFTASESQEEWSALDELPPRMEALRYAGVCPCPRFEVIEEQVIQGFRPEGEIQVFVYDDVFHHIANGLSHVVSLEQGLTATRLPLPGFSPNDHWVAPDGRLLLATSGELVRWEIGTSSTVETARAYEEGHEILGVDGAPTGHPPEIFVTGEGPRIERFDGETWSVVFELPDSLGGGAQDGVVAWTGPDQAVVALHNSRRWVRYEQGRYERFNRPEDIDAFRARARNETLGVLLGTSTGQVVRVLQGELELLEPAPGDPERPGNVEGFSHYRDGELYAIELTQIGYVDPRYGLCPLNRIPGFSVLDGVAAHGDDVIVAGRSLDAEAKFQRLRPLPP